MTVQELLKKSWSLRRNVVDIIMAGSGGLECHQRSRQQH